METALRLLMRDGALYISFKAQLTPQQYAELNKSIKTADTRDELRAVIGAIANRWGVEAEVSDSI